MRKAFLMLVVGLCMVSCKKPYERAIDDYLNDNLKDPHSYENVELGKPEVSTYMSVMFADLSRRSKDGEIPLDSVSVMLERYKTSLERDGVNPYDTLHWSVRHKFRAKNSFGAYEVNELEYHFNKDCDRIIEVVEK